ncbi:hypothetical protein BJY04DRAFT_199369 [Aspergillus karnatakaensis]|uniref:uncharacterized protein n=1 Tax=Aspergillus karnatakaensis TaxID=1810916 RepID=UPI003CCDB06B
MSFTPAGRVMAVACARLISSVVHSNSARRSPSSVPPTAGPLGALDRGLPRDPSGIINGLPITDRGLADVERTCPG